MAVNTDPKAVDEVLSRGVEEVIVEEDLRKEMLSGRPLTIYLGTDVTGSELHLGHATIHLKLRDFQQLGHKIILLIGDFTTLVGDHSDKFDQRIETNSDEIEKNMKTYLDQFGKLIDVSKVEVVYNSSWLKKLGLLDVIDLAKIFTVQQMLERETFQKRLQSQSPVGFDELLYPLMQGFDAHQLNTDIQIGAVDQTFNLMAGRKIMEHFGQKPQNIVTMPLLVGNDGRKMGKSLHNYISIGSSAFEKFTGLMQIVDEVMIQYFISLTRVPMTEVKEIETSLKERSVNPRDIKLRLAFEVTRLFHGEKEAEAAKGRFEKEISRGEMPSDIRTSDAVGDYDILDALVKVGLAESKTQARRLVEQGGVEVGGKKVLSITESIKLETGTVVRAGKKGYIKIV